MKKALINNGIVAQVEDTEFEVAPPLTWIDCPDECEAGWKLHDGNLVEYTPDELVALEIQQAEIITQSITKCRDEKLLGGISVNGIDIQTDDLSQQRLMATRIIAKENPDYAVNWKAGNGFVTLTSEQIIMLADAVRNHVQKCFDTEKFITEQHSENSFNSIKEVEQSFESFFQKLSE